MADTNLAQAVEAANDASSYDTNIKFLLADKQILARILKYAVQEFKDMPIEEISLDRNTVYGNKIKPYDIDLMRGIIINIRNGETIKDSQSILISMLEKLLSRTSVEEKKRILTEEYGMIMTTELEGRMQTMCNWSEAMKEVIFEEVRKEVRKEGMKEGIEKERINAIGRMIQAGATKEQIISFGYTEKEFVEAEGVLFTNVV